LIGIHNLVERYVSGSISSSPRDSSIDSLSSSAAEGIVAELPDAEVRAGKLCGFRDSSPDLGSSGVSGFKGRFRSSMDILVMFVVFRERAKEFCC
jgi:hypothetical protein